MLYFPQGSDLEAPSLWINKAVGLTHSKTQFSKDSIWNSVILTAKHQHSQNTAFPSGVTSRSSHPPTREGGTYFTLATVLILR